jgi:hypothetical protein
MATQLSKGLRNFMLESGSVKRALSNGVIKLYSGAQPADADSAASGTLLVVYTKNSGAFTAEVQATGTITYAGAAGSIDTITVGGVEILGGSVPFTTDLATTVALAAAAVNNNPKNFHYTAKSAAGVLTLTAIVGNGTLVNGAVVASTVTTLTATPVNVSGGVDAVNGLRFGDAAAGTLTKDSGTWSGVALATGTAGWARFYGPVADAGGADTTETALRLDGNVATSGAPFIITSTAINISTTQTIDAATLTEPPA